MDRYFWDAALGLNPLAKVMSDFMHQTGARAGQMAVARNGKLVFNEAFTFAEPGYPITTVDKLFRIGSVSKILTSIACTSIFTQHGTNLSGLATPYLSAAMINAQPANAEALGLVRIEELLRFRAGWDTPVAATFNEDTIASFFGEPHAGPGDVRLFLAQTSDPVLAQGMFPTDESHYSNIQLIAASELVSRALSSSARYDQYQFEVARFYGFEGKPTRLHCARDTWAQSREENEVPAHLLGPSYLSGFSDPSSFEPWQYAENFNFFAGEGGMCISMRDLVRILSSMDPGSSYLEPPLNPEAVRATCSPYVYPYDTDVHSAGEVEPEDFSGNVGNNGLTFSYWGHHFKWGQSAFPQETVVMSKNGEVGGGACVCFHMIPRSTSVSPSLSGAIAVNVDVAIGDGQVRAMLDAAQQMETDGSFGEVDLFGETLIHPYPWPFS